MRIGQRMLRNEHLAKLTARNTGCQCARFLKVLTISFVIRDHNLTNVNSPWWSQTSPAPMLLCGCSSWRTWNCSKGASLGANVFCLRLPVKVWLKSQCSFSALETFPALLCPQSFSFFRQVSSFYGVICLQFLTSNTPIQLLSINAQNQTHAT